MVGFALQILLLFMLLALIGRGAWAATGTVSGTLYTDNNFNNTLDTATDTKLANITVWLYDSTGTTIQKTTTTNASGLYSFGSVASGVTYQVKVDITDTDIPVGSNLTTANPLTGVAYNATAKHFVFSNKDFGDAPDASNGTAAGNYKTKNADGGASHIIVPNLMLGSKVDADNGTLQNASANADDTTGNPDDEDGLLPPPIMSTVAGQGYTLSTYVTNTTGETAYLTAYIDFNRDGDFLDAGEQSATQYVYWTGYFQSSFTLPTGVTAGSVYARLRLSKTRSEVESSIGAASSGEVEDHVLTAAASPYYDFGDAPTTYGSARHTINSSIYLGSINPDAEAANQPSYNANGDGFDEDGAPRQTQNAAITLFPILKMTASSYSVNIKAVNVTGSAGKLLGWIDFNQNGIFEATEAASATAANNTNGTLTLTWNSIPIDIKLGTTFIRLRLTTDGSITTSTPTGNASNGEVEDFPIAVAQHIPPDSPTVTIITGDTPTACSSTVFTDNFNDLPDNQYFGANTSATPYVIRNWTTTGGGGDTYARTLTASAYPTQGEAIYFGNGFVRRISPAIGTAFTFDGNGKLTSPLDAIELRDNADDTTPGTQGGGEADWGPSPVKFSRTFTTTVGQKYRLYFSAIPEDAGSAYYASGIMRVDTPSGSIHFKAPGGLEGIQKYRIEFTAIAASSTISFVNYGHVGTDGGWCDPNSVFSGAWCSAGGSTISKNANELIIDDVTVAAASACATSNIAGVVYADKNLNNAFDSATETGLGNISVTLYNNNGTTNTTTDDTKIAVTDTAANGAYSFADVSATPHYRIEVDTHDPELPLSAYIGTTNPLADVTVAAGSNVTNQTFGFDLACDASAGQFGGIAFRDYNQNGSRESQEEGIAGVIVTAYDNTNASVATATTDAHGWYKLAGLTNGSAYRLEYTGLATGLASGAHGTDATTNVRFVTATGNCANHYGISDPVEYCQATPTVATSSYTGGNPTIAAVGDYPSIHTFPYDASGSDTTQTYTAKPKATTGQTGALWGMAYQKSTKTLYASAAMRRFAGFGTLGTGGIYKVDMTNPTTNSGAAAYIDVRTIGIPTGNDVRVASDSCNNLASSPTLAAHDVAAWDAVGKVGIGDIDYDETNNKLWLVNLNDRKLYGIQNISPTTAPTAANVLGGYAINLPSPYTCTSGTFRPWAVKYYRGYVYVGGVCDAASDPYTVANIKGYVLKFNPANTAAGFSYVKDFALDQDRPSYAYDNATMKWNGWIPQTDAVGWPYFHSPIVGNLEFDTDGSIIVGVIDRAGLQNGNNSYDDPSCTDTSVDYTSAEGDILRLCKTDTGYLSDSAPGCTSNIPANRKVQDEYYWGDMGPYPNAWESMNEVSLGGLALAPGKTQVLTSAYDAANWGSNSVVWLNNATGGNDNSYHVAWTTTGKTAGMGELEVMCDPAPIEVGNRVWLDTDKDGLQDAGEAGIANVNVTLTCGVDSATTATNAQGEYYFANKTGGNATFMGSGESCSLSINNTQASLGTNTLTTQNADSKTDNNSQTDIRDSDAAVSGSNAVLSFTVGNAGQNNHGLDFGYKSTVVATTLTGTVWFDANNDGIQNDGTNAGIEGSTVELYATSTNSITATTTTNANGQYQFTGLPAATAYQVRILKLDNDAPLSAWGITTANAGTDPNLDSNATLSGNYWVVAVTSPAAGATTSGNDIGFLSTTATGCLGVGSTGVSDEGITNAHSNTYDFAFAGKHVVGYCAERSEADPQTGDNYTVNATDRQGLIALTREKIARSYAALHDPDIVFAIASTFGAGNNQRRLDDLLHYMTWYYTHYNEDLNAMSAAVLDTNSNYTAPQRIAMKTLAGKVADRVNGANGETQYPVQDIFWLWNMTSSSRQDIVVPAVYTGGSVCQSAKDYGDAPATYGTPAHTIVTNFHLGANAPDSETAAQPSATATLDDTTSTDDEDGVILPSLIKGQTAVIPITVVGASGKLQAWIDWNADGDFTDTGEQIATNVTDNGAGDTNSTNGSIGVSVAVPATAVASQTYARFRWSTLAGLDSTSSAIDGEIEDYALTITHPPLGCSVLDTFDSTSTQTINLTTASPGPITQTWNANIDALIGGTRTVTFGPAPKSTATNGYGLLDVANNASSGAAMKVCYNANGAGLNANLSQTDNILFNVWEDEHHNPDAATRANIPMTITLSDGTNSASLTQDMVNLVYQQLGTVDGWANIRFPLASFTGLSSLNRANIQSICIDVAGKNGHDYAFEKAVLEDTATCKEVSGKVFEDVNYGGGAGRAFGATGAQGTSGTTLELYDNSGHLLESATSNSTGNYVFAGLTPNNYYVRAVSSSVKSTRSGTNGTERGIMTYRSDGITATTNSVGGYQPSSADANSNGWRESTLNTGTFVFSGNTLDGKQAQVVQPITVAAANLSNVSFGFNFDTVTNANDSGAGSLRQFILNAALLGSDSTLAQTGRTAGKENAILELSTSDPNYNAANQYWSIPVLSELPLIGDDIILDASTQPARTGFAFANRPVIELNGSNAGQWINGLRLNGATNGSTVKYFAINRFNGAGIKVLNSKNNLITANIIGTDPLRSATNIGNSGHGIDVISPVGLSAISNNVIAHNAGHGITAWNFNGVGTATAATISSNSIYANGGLGIDLGITDSNSDVTINDANDTDTGANSLLNFPILSSISASGSNLIVKGCAPAGATVELFEADVSAGGKATPGANKLGKSKDYGEGQTYLASFVEGVADADNANCALAVDADGNNQTGMKAFNVTITPAPASFVIGDMMTATATIATSGTSEFSPALLMQEVGSISGKIFEDVNYGGGAGRAFADATGAAGITGATVELRDTSNVLITSATTTAGGTYTLADIPLGSYTVKVVGDSVSSTRTGSNGNELGVMTYSTATGATTDSVGQPATQAVTLNGMDLSNVNFGFNFDTVSNTNDSGAGSLRQFLLNANLLGGDSTLAQTGRTPGKENAILMLPMTDPNYSGGIWKITLNTGLPPIDHTLILDGTQQETFNNSTAKPVIELNGNNGAGHGLTLVAGSSGSMIRSLILTKFSGDGISVQDTSTNNSFLGNSIYANSGLGIDLANDSVTANDAADADDGANGLLNYPEAKTNSFGANGSKLITYDFNLDVAAGTYRLEFFTSTVPDASGNGEGETFIGAKDITHLGNGSVNFKGTLNANMTVAKNTFISTTLTQITGATTFGSTSEFSGVKAGVTTQLCEALADGTAGMAMDETTPTTIIKLLAAKDTDGQLITYFISGGVDGNLFTVINATATDLCAKIKFITSDVVVTKAASVDVETRGIVTPGYAPLPGNYEQPRDAGGDNVYNFQVTGTTSSGKKYVRDMSVRVLDTNEAPVITSAAMVNFTEDSAANIVDIASQDPDIGTAEGKGLTYRISSGADAAYFEVDAASGILRFRAVPDYDAPMDTNRDNVYEVEVSVTDAGGLSGSKLFTVTVTNNTADDGVILNARAVLQGVYDSSTQLMSADLNALKLLPKQQPYNGAPFKYAGTETLSTMLQETTGNNAVVDWALVDLRSSPSTVVASRAVMLQRDGDLVDAQTGSANLHFAKVSGGNYYVSVRHRNHLGVISASPVSLSNTTRLVNFADSTTVVKGEESRLVAGKLAMLWAGDLNGSNTLTANGPGNDVTSLLSGVISSADNVRGNTNHILSGYLTTDLNMDGKTLFTGPGNDTSLLVGNILLHPLNTGFAANYIVKGGLQ
jgi:hypothetical protein